MKYPVGQKISAPAAPAPVPAPDDGREERRLAMGVAAAALSTMGGLWAVGLTPWLAVPLGLAVAWYGLVFAATLTAPASQAFRWRDLPGTPPDDVQQAIRAASDEVRALGFVPRGVLYYNDGDPEQYTWASDHPETHVTALLVTERDLHRPRRPMEVSLSFATRLRGNHRLGTLSARNPAVAVGRRGLMNFPGLRAAELYRVHRFRTAAVRDLVVPPLDGQLALRLLRRDEL
ncbi:MAG TPA: hypothetical protein VF705_14325, partial [Longimicrobium sp.]